jgi:hypothetical protein
MLTTVELDEYTRDQLFPLSVERNTSPFDAAKTFKLSTAMEKTMPLPPQGPLVLTHCAWDSDGSEMTTSEATSMMTAMFLILRPLSLSVTYPAKTIKSSPNGQRNKAGHHPGIPLFTW